LERVEASKSVLTYDVNKSLFFMLRFYRQHALRSIIHAKMDDTGAAILGFDCIFWNEIKIIKVNKFI